MAGKIARRRFVKMGAAVLGTALLPVKARAATPVTLTYLDFVTPNDGSPRGNALARMLKAFAEAYPNTKIELQNVPSTEIPQQLLKSAAAGKSPDVAKVHIPDVSAQVAAGTIIPLDSYVSGWDKSDWLVDWSSTMVGGKKVAIPWDYRPDVLLYRKKILADHGAAVPTTWAEVLAGAKKIGGENPMGYAVGLSKNDNGDCLAECFSSGMISAGGQLFNADGTAAINSEPGIMMFQFINDLFAQGGTSQAAVNFTYFSTGDGLTAGTIAMAMLGSQRVAQVASGGAKDDVGFTAAPGWGPTKPGQSNALSQTLVVAKSCQHTEEAMQFIEFMTGSKTAVDKAQGGEVPPRKSSYSDPYFSTPAAANVTMFKEILVAHPGHTNSYPVKYWDLKQALAEAAQTMVLQKQSPKTVLDAAAKKYNAVIGK